MTGANQSLGEHGAAAVSYHIPDEETLDRYGLACLQRQKLSDLLRAVIGGNEFYTKKFAGLTFDAKVDPLDRLPLTTRDELQADQAAHPPYGTNLTFPVERYTRLHQTSGSQGQPLCWLDTPDSWAWWRRCWGVIYRAAGVKADDRLFFPFSFGPFIGFWGAFESAVELGNLALPAGGMTTTARLRYLLDHRVTIVCCTPTYALRMAEVAHAEGIDLVASDVRGLIVAGEPGGSIPATRARIESAWGARVFDHPGMTELGPWGFECEEAPGGVHVMESEFLVETIDPRTLTPVGDGELGELVLTNLGRIGSPLIRYRTGDQARLIRSRCACGRWFARADGGILGRSDDMLVIRGNNVFPSAVEGIIREFDEIAEFAVVADHAGSLVQLRISIEPAGDCPVGGVDLATRLAAAIQDRLHFSVDVSVLEAGSLPRFEMKARRWERRG